MSGDDWRGWRGPHGRSGGGPWARADGQPWPRRRPRGPAPVFVAIIQLVGTGFAAANQTHATPMNALAYALLLIGPWALFFRVRHPLCVLGLTLAVTGAYLALDYPRGPFFLAALVALFGAMRRAGRGRVWALSILAYVAYVLVTSLWTVGNGQPSVVTYVVVGVCVVIAGAVAEAARVQGQQFAELSRARAEAARADEEQSRRQASDERLRIARELHDVLGHHLSLINVRAGVALHLLDTRPEQAREALDAIKQASSEALREVRGVLATLRPSDEAAPRAPAPGLASVDHLAGEARAAGLEVSLRREGRVRPMPAEVDRAAYRIVQEALTNVRRHAGPAATVTVLIGYRPNALTLRIDDTGTGPSSAEDGSGNGIPGMRERAAALGGTLVTQAPPDGGFRVEAYLPVDHDPDVDAAPPLDHGPDVDANPPLHHDPDREETA